jgi:hypothetical protein
VARVKRKKGRGSLGSASRGGGNGEERVGVWTRVRDSWVADIGPRPEGTGGGAVAQQGRAAGSGHPAHAQLTDGTG